MSQRTPCYKDGSLRGTRNTNQGDLRLLPQKSPGETASQPQDKKQGAFRCRRGVGEINYSNIHKERDGSLSRLRELALTDAPRKLEGTKLSKV